MAVLGTNITVSVQQTLGAAITVTAVTKASTGVVTYTPNSPDTLANGDIVVFNVAGGMVEIDGQAVRVANWSSGQFDAEGLDTTDFSTWTEGTINEVTAFQVLRDAQNITMPNPTPAKIDITTLIDKVKQYAYGLPDAPDGSVSGLFNPTATAYGLIRTATKGNDEMVWKVVFASGLTAVFNANVSGGTGFDLQTNQAATSTISFTPIRDVMYYAS